MYLVVLLLTLFVLVYFANYSVENNYLDLTIAFDRCKIIQLTNHNVLERPKYFPALVLGIEGQGVIIPLKNIQTSLILSPSPSFNIYFTSKLGVFVSTAFRED